MNVPKNVVNPCCTIMYKHRYCKQRGYMTTNTIVVKFLPIPFAVLIANLILIVKPIEDSFVRTEGKAGAEETSHFLFTVQGAPVQPLKMAGILATTFSEHGLVIDLHHLRHGLEAFGHKLSDSRGTGWNPMYAFMSNHGVPTSASYGRDQNCFVGIPADVSEDNCRACEIWNNVILQSPSKSNKHTQAALFQQLQQLGLVDEDDMIMLAEEQLQVPP